MSRDAILATSCVGVFERGDRSFKRYNMPYRLGFIRVKDSTDLVPTSPHGSSYDFLTTLPNQNKTKQPLNDATTKRRWAYPSLAWAGFG